MKQNSYGWETLLFLSVCSMIYFIYTLMKDFNIAGNMFKNFFFFYAGFLAVGIIINKIVGSSTNQVISTNKKVAFKTIIHKMSVLILLAISTFSISLFIVELIGHGILTSEIMAYQIATVVFSFLTQIILIISYTKF